MRDDVIRSTSTSNPLSYKRLVEKLRGIDGVGLILGQHLVHLMTMTSLISPRYGASFLLFSGGQMAKRLFKHNIKPSFLPSLLEYVCAYYGWLPYIAANAIFMALSDPDEKYVDGIYCQQQALQRVMLTSGGEYKICVLRRHPVNVGSVNCAGCRFEKV